MPTVRQDLPAFGARLDQLIAKVEGADVRVPEDSALISLATDLVPEVTHLLREGIDLLVAIEDSYGPAGDSPEREAPLESLSQIGRQISTEFAARDLIDMTFFARADLKNSLEVLIAWDTLRHDQMTLASHCESGLRRLRKALISVESAVFEFDGQQPPTRQWFDVEVSLQIRKLYWNLRRETGKDRGENSLEKRLRSVLYRILAFRELSVYPFLRVDDRVNMRQLMKRILDWLNSHERDEGRARRLWEDLSSFAEILVQVSHRQELQDHDLRLVAKAYRTLFPFGGECQRVPDELLAALQSLLGLDDELDRLITAGNARPVEAWREPLRRLQTQLSRSGEPSGTPEIWPA